MSTLVLYGGVAALLVEMLGIIEQRRRERAKLEAYIRNWFYWLCVLGLVVIGGYMVHLFEVTPGTELTPLLASNIGASGPALLRQLGRAFDIEPGSVAAPNGGA